MFLLLHDYLKKEGFTGLILDKYEFLYAEVTSKSGIIIDLILTNPLVKNDLKAVKCKKIQSAHRLLRAIRFVNEF